MTITATELRTHFGKYLELVKSEDIVITRNGREIAWLVKVEDDAHSDVSSLVGIPVADCSHPE